jgi:hypothetical protein
MLRAMGHPFSTVNKLNWKLAGLVKRGPLPSVIAVLSNCFFHALAKFALTEKQFARFLATFSASCNSRITTEYGLRHLPSSISRGNRS